MAAEVNYYEVIVIPEFLVITDTNITNCPNCSEELTKTSFKAPRLVYNCGACDRCRPFDNRIYPCSCKYEDKDFLEIVCNYCKFSECDKCGVITDYKTKRCDVCCKIEAKKSFNNKFTNMNIEERLNMYGTKKLKLLASRKKLKRYSTYRKKGLIAMLVPITDFKDFPIRE